MQLLHIDSSILEGASASRELSSAIVDELCRQLPGAIVIKRDVISTPIPHLDAAIAAGFRPIQGENAEIVPHPEHARSQKLVKELLASDVIVIGTPMYNFSIASQLKAWIDRVMQPGITFRYTEQGPVGLTRDKRVVVASTRGGMYSAGPGASMDFQEAYLKAVFGFMGIDKVFFIRAESLSRGAEARLHSMQDANAAVSAAVKQALAN